MGCQRTGHCPIRWLNRQFKVFITDMGSINQIGNVFSQSDSNLFKENMIIKETPILAWSDDTMIFHLNENMVTCQLVGLGGQVDMF